MGAIRLFLALVVASTHWQMAGPQPLNIDARLRLGFSGSEAVLCFYVISGFLITWTLSRNYTPDLAGARRFWTNRLIRIFALFWPLAAFALIVYPAPAPASWVDWLTGLFLLGSDWRAAFAAYPDLYSGANLPGFGQAWTLGAELAFYLMAPLLMRSWRLAAALLAASLAVRGWFVATLGPQLHAVWTYFFLPSTLCFFLLGHFACRAGDAFAWLRRPRFGAALLAACVVVMTFVPAAGFDTPRLWIAIACFTAGLPAVFAATRDVRWLNALGELSYPVYLVHNMAFTLLWDAIAAVTAGMAGKLVPYLSIAAALLIVIAIAAALVPLERAVSRLMHGAVALGRRRGRLASAS